MSERCPKCGHLLSSPFGSKPERNREIVRRYEVGGVKMARLAEEYGLTQPAIRQIILRYSNKKTPFFKAKNEQDL